MTMNTIKKYWIGFLLMLLVFGAALLIYQKLHTKQLSDNLIMGSGRIDGDLINLGSKYPGRIEKIYFSDGDRVKKGDTVAQIASGEFEARATSMDAQIDAARKELLAKKTELAIAFKTISLTLDKTIASVKGAKANKEALKQKAMILKNLIAQDRRDFQRLQKLYRQKLIDKHQLELSSLKYQSDKENLAVLFHQIHQLKEAVNIAQSTQDQARAQQEKKVALKEGIETLKAKIRALEASKEEIQTMIDELQLHSPVDGFVVEKIANEGEVIGSGMPVVTLLDPKSLYLQLFVDTLQNGKIHIGNVAEIFLDAYPDKPIPAKVVSIAQKAEFTPKEVSVREDRIQRVFAVHLKPIKENPLLKLGIPAIGVISTDGKALPASLHDVPPL